VITIHQRYRQTDRQTTCDGNTALCTKVHRAVMKINTMSDKCFITMWLYLLNKHNRHSDYTTLQTACCNILQLVLLCVSHFHISRGRPMHHACSSLESQLASSCFCWLYPSLSCFSLVSLTSNLDRSYSGFMICWDHHKRSGVWLSSELDF